ncbi:MAG: hypothetical protein Q7R80_03495, partial [bacterium]|nr:hypothetical protein [bacterium]
MADATASIAPASAGAPVKPETLASHINGRIDQLHVDTVSDDPFAWTPTAAYANGKAVLADVAALLRGYHHVSKTGTVTMLLVLGAALPLLLAFGAWQQQVFLDEEVRFLVCAGLCVVALISTILACVIGTPATVDLDIGLAWYCISRGWGFSRLHQEGTWQQYQKRFSYFEC